ncbi:MAG TPA: DUF488 family protein [Dermatophilaceae bacterium]|jgi:uncharacterized protein YeaO (DUF488 family)|nr:DUF488 family protein [Actinomycetales bacterium]HMT32819.1 DUF488 family protein [Dermatophilaceae bacterium]HMT88751.1 DUF488 family protein [Dermatophilaceae bacterium]HOS92562.1 DUF488 family protein [Armatimonadota bacterium]
MPGSSPVRVARVYDPPDPTAGQRVLVDRLWPRGLSKQRAALTLWCKEVAPSTELRRWYAHDPAKFTEFATRYRSELRDDTHAAALAGIRQLMTTGPIVLLTASRRSDLSEAAVLESILSGTP